MAGLSDPLIDWRRNGDDMTDRDQPELSQDPAYEDPRDRFDALADKFESALSDNHFEVTEEYAIALREGVGPRREAIGRQRC